MNSAKVKIEIFCDERVVSENGAATFFVEVVSSEVRFAILEASGVNATVYNCEGKNYLGEKFHKYVKIEADKPKKFWITAENSGECRLVLKDENGDELTEKTIEIFVSGSAPDVFAASAWLNRLAWLNSDRAIDHGVTKPFDKVSVVGDEISITGRKISLKNGFPCKIKSRFNESGKLTDCFVDILSSPVEFKAGEERFCFGKAERTVFDDCVIEKNEGKSENFRIFIVTKVEFDGFIEVKNALECLKDVEISDIRLEIPLCGEKT